MKSATVSMMPMTMKKFAVPLPVSPSASALAAATLPWKNADRPMARQGRAGEGDHDEGSGLTVRVALLPRADARLRREARAERAAHGGQAQRTRHTNKFNAHNTFLLFLIIF